MQAAIDTVRRAISAFFLGTALGLAASQPLFAKDTLTAAQTLQTETVALAQLPVQARKTHALILQGGPFPYEKDGTVFGNRERLLPKKKRGYYREYTVKTPRVRTRGARRIVCGGQQPTEPDACYYTSDHYSSFQKIEP